MTFLNDKARETFEAFEAKGLTAEMVKAEMRRSRDTVVSVGLIRCAAARNFIAA